MAPIQSYEVGAMLVLLLYSCEVYATFDGKIFMTIENNVTSARFIWDSWNIWNLKFV
jgi:hypothetical protein